MAKFLRHVVVGKMLEIGIVPVFYNSDLEVCKNIVRACAEGGAKVVEFTNRGDRAYGVFSELSEWCDREIPEAILGVGSVIDPGTAAIYINSGANFIVGPVLNPDVAKTCNRRKIAYSPGCGTVSEVSQAEELGADIVKIFPGLQVGGPEFVRNLLGPCPWALIMPTGGVDSTRESIFAWIKAGTACLGMGSNLITKELVRARDFAGITKKVEDCIWWVKEARGTPLFLGVEHVGLSATQRGQAVEIADWYASIFGFVKTEGTSSFFVSGAPGQGRIEVMKTEERAHTCHIAVRVSNFEMACKYLQDKGIELEEPKIKADTKAVFLRKPDPAGNRVHLIYR